MKNNLRLWAFLIAFAAGIAIALCIIGQTRHSIKTGFSTKLKVGGLSFWNDSPSFWITSLRSQKNLDQKEGVKFVKVRNDKDGFLEIIDFADEPFELAQGEANLRLYGNKVLINYEKKDEEFRFDIPSFRFFARDDDIEKDEILKEIKTIYRDKEDVKNDLYLHAIFDGKKVIFENLYYKGKPVLKD